MPHGNRFWGSVKAEADTKCHRLGVKRMLLCLKCTAGQKQLGSASVDQCPGGKKLSAFHGEFALLDGRGQPKGHPPLTKPSPSFALTE